MKEGLHTASRGCVAKGHSVCDDQLIGILLHFNKVLSWLHEHKSVQAEKEIADLRAVLDDLAAKVEDLEAAVKEKAATRKALRDAFSQVAGVHKPGPSYPGSSRLPV